MYVECTAAHAHPADTTTHTRQRGGKEHHVVSTIHCVPGRPQILEEWDISEYDRHLDAVEQAVRAATADALADVRAISRLLMGAYAYAQPDRAHTMIRRADAATAEKLNAAVQQYPGQGSMAFPQEPVDVPPAHNGSVTRRALGSPAPDTAARPGCDACVLDYWCCIPWCLVGDQSSSSPSYTHCMQVSSTDGCFRGPHCQAPLRPHCPARCADRICVYRVCINMEKSCPVNIVPHAHYITTGSSGGLRRPGSAGSAYEMPRAGRGGEASRVATAPLSARRDTSRSTAQRLPLRTPRVRALQLHIRVAVVCKPHVCVCVRQCRRPCWDVLLCFFFLFCRQPYTTPNNNQQQIQPTCTDRMMCLACAGPRPH